MDFTDYQKKANETDQFPKDGQRGESISLFGLIGEIGSLITIFKKRLRDKSSYVTFNEDVKEEMGDILWYIANIATKYKLSLNDIAEQNLIKTKAMWPSVGAGSTYVLYDESFPVNEQILRKFNVTFAEDTISTIGSMKVNILLNGNQVGDSLTDNSYDNDGYRYHDVFHLSYAAVLGWSPVMRWMHDAKRKSDAVVDEVEDGARAILTEELISLYVYNYAKKHSFFEGVSHIDSEVISTIRSLVSGFEVENRSSHDWAMAILKGYEVFRVLLKEEKGVVEVDLYERKIHYSKLEKL